MLFEAARTERAAEWAGAGLGEHEGPQGSVDWVAMTQKRGNGCGTLQKLLLEFSAIHTLQQAGESVRDGSVPSRGSSP